MSEHAKFNLQQNRRKRNPSYERTSKQIKVKAVFASITLFLLHIKIELHYYSGPSYKTVKSNTTSY